MIRFFFYCLAAALGAIGFLSSAWNLASDLLRRITAGANQVALEFDDVLLLFASTFLLIGVHLAHRLANVFEWPARSAEQERPLVSDVSGTPWEKNPGFTGR